MKASLQYLRPYKSLILAEFAAKNQTADWLVGEFLDDMVAAFKLDGKDPARELIQKAGPTKLNAETEVGFLQFTQNELPAWTSEVGITDTINHLALVLRHRRAVAIYVSDPAMRQAVMNRIDDENGLGLSKLQTISRARLNAAFVKGRTRTLWLSGVHRRTSIKADSKILAGVDLQDALNPLDDQTYNFTAARCATKLTDREVTVGAVPRQSRVWLGRSKHWTDFWEGTVELLAHLQKVKKGNNAPLPILAKPVTDTSGVKDAFDVSFQPPELMSDDQAAQAASVQELERWAYESDFQITKTNGTNLSATLKLTGKTIGHLDLTVDLSDPENAVIEASGKPASAETKAEFDEALRLCRRPHWISIRYDSGHTVSDGLVLEVAYRDMSFLGFEWADFTGFNVDQEKPAPLDATGQKESLFCWVQKHWPNGNGKNAGGWLSCDDGAMEIADFIHLDPTGKVPVLSLIHVKGAGSDAKGRSISVSKYEVVVGQAVKNLRHLDRMLLADGLEKGLGKKISKLVWKDRQPAAREDFVKALRKIGHNYRRRVVIVQPHVTEAKHSQAQANREGSDAARLRQLDTLLIGAEMNCRALGAELIVLAAK